MKFTIFSRSSWHLYHQYTLNDNIISNRHSRLQPVTDDKCRHEKSSYSYSVNKSVFTIFLWWNFRWNFMCDWYELWLFHFSRLRLLFPRSQNINLWMSSIKHVIIDLTKSCWQEGKSWSLTFLLAMSTHIGGKEFCISVHNYHTGFSNTPENGCPRWIINIESNTLKFFSFLLLASHNHGTPNSRFPTNTGSTKILNPKIFQIHVFFCTRIIYLPMWC